jgi:hypothetical protein
MFADWRLVLCHWFVRFLTDWAADHVSSPSFSPSFSKALQQSPEKDFSAFRVSGNT